MYSLMLITEYNDKGSVNFFLICVPTSPWNLLNVSEDNCEMKHHMFQVHVVKDATRGATLEVVVSRMKAVHTYRAAQNPDAGLSMRFVAVSATIPNISDVSDW